MQRYVIVLVNEPSGRQRSRRCANETEAESFIIKHRHLTPEIRSCTYETITVVEEEDAEVSASDVLAALGPDVKES
jgi:hypothetical protein